MRLVLLWSIVWIARLTEPLFKVLGRGYFRTRPDSARRRAVPARRRRRYEIHDKLEGEDHAAGRAAASFASVIGQIMVLDIVFSLDSVITAIGMADNFGVMAAAVVLAVLVMLVAGRADQRVRRTPSDAEDAGAVVPAADRPLAHRRGLGQHISKGYIYFAMGFSVFVEAINLRVRKGRAPVHLHRKYEP